MRQKIFITHDQKPITNLNCKIFLYQKTGNKKGTEANAKKTQDHITIVILMISKRKIGMQRILMKHD
jgi:hypothetical protein